MRNLLAVDFGDAPDLLAGTGVGNYNTRLTDNGPSHTIVAGLKLGANVDGDDGTLQNAAASADDVNAALPDDEDGLSNSAADLTFTVGAQPTVNVRATNTTGAAATLFGWIDYNHDGMFDNATERALVAVPTGTSSATFTLVFPMIPLGASAGGTYARFRLSTDVISANPFGSASDGEVEDYVAAIVTSSDLTADAARNKKIASATNGGPTLENDDDFGSAVASVGDLDGDGITDLAVGAPGYTFGGAIYVLFMNADGTAKGSTKIVSGINGGPVLDSFADFGQSVASLGDMDGDGVVDLAVGAPNDTNPGDVHYRGAIYVLYMNADGTVKSSTKIDGTTNGGLTLLDHGRFGSSIASVGDLDGDGITDVAVGAHEDDTGGDRRGAVYILFMNANGTAKSSTKIASGTNGAPTLANHDTFGASLASLGDLDGDGITDFAVGAADSSTGGIGFGAVHILFMNADGTVKSTTKIASATNGGPTLEQNGKFGSSIQSLGDLDGDGVTDLGVGAFSESTDGMHRGAIYVLLMNSNGTAKSTTRIASATNGGPTLANSDLFGTSLALLGDLDGDGVVDLAVGARGDDTGGSSRGAVHVLFMQPDVTSPTVSLTRQSPAASRTNADTLVFRATFNEYVLNVDASDFIVSGGTTAEIVAITAVSSSTYEITVGGGDLVAYNGLVGLDLASGHDIVDASSNALANTEPITDETYILDNTRPTLLSVSRLFPLVENTSANKLRFRATFSEIVLNVDVTDFLVTETTATLTVSAISGSVYDLTVSGGDLSSLAGIVGIDLASSQNIVDVDAVNALPNVEPSIDETFTLTQSGIDFGDAPDSALGAGPGNYRTTLIDNGPRHTIVAGLKLGTIVDEEPDAVTDSDAMGDDLVLQPDKNDEDGLVIPGPGILLPVTALPQIRVRATNTTSAAATLYGWIDYNRDGVFENATERASAAVPAGTNNGAIALSFPRMPANTLLGETYARFRLSTDVAAAESIGAAADGEVEDHLVTIVLASNGVAENTKTKKIASQTNGGPALADGDSFGGSVASIGDLDGDGVTDVAVGASADDTGGTGRGALYVHFMNVNGTVKSSVKIASGTNGGPALVDSDLFGSSVTSLGDLDGDGVNDLAVGARGDGIGSGRGAVYVLFMNASGTVKSSMKIGHSINGGPALGSDENFGSSLATLGDLDGDGITEVAVGASGYDTTLTNRGAVHILYLNANGSVKTSTRIGNGIGLVSSDYFGASVASPGDVDGDGIADLAVGARGDDTGGSNRGAVHVLLLNANGTLKSAMRIASATNGGPTLKNSDYFGSSVASLGDVDGDGIADLAVGARGDDTGGSARGAIHLLRLNANGSVNYSTPLSSDTNGGPTLANDDRFGSSVTTLGDFDGDGVTDLAVGAYRDDTGGSERGAVYVLFLQPDTTPPSVSFTRQAPLANSTHADSLVFRATFSERALNVDASDFVIAGETSATISAITAISSSVYDITFSGGDLATYNGLVGLNLATGQNITDLNGNALPTVEPAVDELYTVFNTPPKLLSISRLLPLAQSTSANGVRFRATFDKGVVNVDATDFVAVGTTATLAVSAVSGSGYDLTLSGGDLSSLVGTVGINLALSHNILDTLGQSLLTIEPTIDETYSLVPSTTDFGDAPDSAPGAGPGNYRTTLADDGPRHTIVAGLKLGASIDEEPDASPNNSALGDGLYVAPDKNDEDGLSDQRADLLLTVGTQPTANVRATNTTSTAATLYGWIDYNRDGVFDNATECASIAVPTGTSNVTFTLTFPTIPLSASLGATYTRFRLSTDVAAATPTGAAADGEVEDYVVTITKVGAATADTTKNMKVASATSGGPTLVNFDSFGGSVASLGDLDGDNVTDLAVGAVGDDTGGTDRGALYVQFMNVNGTVKNSVKIASGTNGGPTLVNGDAFGSSVASLGDLDGDGVTDLAVGATGDDNGGNSRGAIHVLFMSANGTVKTSTKIANAINGGPTLATSDYFGTSIASVGDLDGDGLTDLVVGATGDDTGGSARGAVHVLLMNANGSVKSTLKIASGTNGGPTLVNGDAFGRSVASLGDLDGDGVTDLAVGAIGDDTGGASRGAVHVLFMNANGSVKSAAKIASDINGGPPLVNGNAFGGSVASLGDLDGDGVADLGVGATNDSTGGSTRGAVHVLSMNANGSVKGAQKIISGFNGGPTLAAGDTFAASVALLSDLDGDGIIELAVGATGDDTGGSSRGALHVLFLKPPTIPALLGDYNVDGTVDAADFVLWRRTLNTGVPSRSGADGSGNGIIDAADYDIWRANFGNTLPSPASGSVANAEQSQVPESPTSQLEADLQTPTADGEGSQGEPTTPSHVVTTGLVPPAAMRNGSSKSFRAPKGRDVSNMETVAASHDRALVAWLAAHSSCDKMKDAPHDFDPATSEFEHGGPSHRLKLALDLAFETCCD